MAAVFVTAIVGVLGVVLGGRVLSGQAHDDQERRELRRFKYAGMVTVIVTAIGFEVRSRVTTSDWPDLLVFAGFTLALASFHFVWLPRILQRRFEAEMRDDPVRALARRRRERRGAIIGWTLGLGGAWVGLVLKLWLSPGDAVRLLQEEVFARMAVHDLSADDRLAMLKAAAQDGTAGGRIYDAHIAEVARSAGATVIVTDNRRHFLAALRHGIRVETPSEGLASLKHKRS